MAPIEREQQTQQQRPEHEAGGEVRDPVVAEVIRREDTVRDLDAPQDVQPTSPTRGDPRVRHEEVHRCAVDQHRLDRVARRVAHPETPVRTPAAVEEAVVVQARCGSRERQLHRSGEVEAAFGQGRQDHRTQRAGRPCRDQGDDDDHREVHVVAGDPVEHVGEERSDGRRDAACPPHVRRTVEGLQRPDREHGDQGEPPDQRRHRRRPLGDVTPRRGCGSIGHVSSERCPPSRRDGVRKDPNAGRSRPRCGSMSRGPGHPVHMPGPGRGRSPGSAGGRS